MVSVEVVDFTVIVEVIFSLLRSIIDVIKQIHFLCSFLFHSCNQPLTTSVTILEAAPTVPPPH